MAIRGNLAVKRVDNGVVLEWYEGREMDKRAEVFVTSGALIQRLDSLLECSCGKNTPTSLGDSERPQSR